MSSAEADLARVIARAAATPVAAVPGGGASLDLLDAVGGLGGDVVVPHHESTAGTIASTLGALTGRPGIAVTIKGPGLANLMPALAHAHLEDRPMVALVEAHPPGSGAHHKRLDHRTMTAPIVRAHGAAAAASALEAALTIAGATPPGPVLLDLIDGAPPSAAPDAYEADVTVGVGAAERDAALAALAAARRPVLLAGAAAGRSVLGPRLAGAGVPVATTVAGKGVVDERRAPAAGIVTGVGGPRSTETALLADADLVVAVGVRVQELLAPLDGLPVVTVGGDGAAIARQHAGHVQLDELDEALALLTADGLDPTACHGRVVALTDALVADDAWLPAAVLAAAAAALTDDTARDDVRDGEANRVGASASPTVVLDTGDFCTIAEHVLAARAPGDVIGAACSRAMGAGIATALGAALARPARPTLLAVGDGGIGGAFGELTLAVERALPLVVLLLEDGGFASIRGRAERLGRSTATLVHPPRGWARAAEGLGLAATVATSVAEVTAALEARPHGPLLVSCAFDAARYGVMAEGLR